MRIFPVVIGLAGILFLSGCVDVEEDVWVNGDGSGRIKIDISVISEEAPTFGSQNVEEAVKSYRENMIRDMGTKRENIKKIKNVRVTDVSEIYAQKKGGVDHFIYDIKTSNIENLDDIYQEIKRDQIDEELKWYITVKKYDKNRILFAQIFESTPKENNLKTEEETPPEEVSERFYKVRLRAPKIITTNGKLDKACRMAEWTIPFSELAGDKYYKKELTAEIYLSPLKHYLIATGLGAGAILLITAGIYVRRRRKT